MRNTKALSKTYGLFAGLDIGTDKICCAIGQFGYDAVQGEELPSSSPQIYLSGVGQRAAKGVHVHGITDIEACEDAILNAVYAAEEAAGKNIKEVYVSIPTSLLKSQRVQTQLTLSGETPIQSAHLRRLFSLSRNIPVPENQYIIHIWPLSYQLDDISGIQDPVGMIGKELSATCHIITAARSYIQNITQCIGRCNLDIVGFVSDAYAAGLACLINDEAELGVTLIDIGGKSTQIACFHEGNLVWLRSIPLGSFHITSDLARGLGTTILQAERIKALYGSLGGQYVESAEQVAITQVGEQNPRIEYVSRQLICDIIQARVEEILEAIIRCVEQMPPDVDKVVLQKVILTGGAFHLHGFAELTSKYFNTKVRIGIQNDIKGSDSILQSPSFSTGAGLLHYAAQDYIGGKFLKDQKPLSLKRRLFKWLNFG